MAEVKREEPTKDSKAKRVNFDNERQSKFDATYEKRGSKPSSNKTRSSRKPHKSAANRTGDKSGRQTTKIALYARNPAVLESVARVGVQQFAGALLPGVTDYTVPAVMRLYYSTAPLGSDQNVMTQAMNDQYSFVVHANSRNYTYSPEALMTLQLAGIDIFSAIALGLRVYGIYRNYNAMSQYLPDALIRAAGFEPSSIRANAAVMLGQLNLLVARSQQIWIPTTMNYLTRWWQLNSEIYVDSESALDQYYMFVPNGFRRLEVSDEGYYTLKFDQWFGVQADATTASTAFKIAAANPVSIEKETLITWNDYIDSVNAMIDAITVVQDRGVIYGDLLNAYGASNIFKLSEPDPNYITPVINDHGMLTQIMNCTLSPFIPTDITIDSPSTFPNLMQKWVMTPHESGIIPLVALGNTYLNFKHKDVATSEDIINATRLIAVGQAAIESVTVKADTTISTEHYISSYSGDNARPFAFGSEIVTALAVIGYTPVQLSGGGRSVSWVTDFYMGFSYYTTNPTTVRYITPDSPASAQGTNVQDSRSRSRLTAFDWRPMQYLLFAGQGKLRTQLTVGTLPVNPGMALEDIFALNFEAETLYHVNPADLVNLNTACLQSLCGVPISMALSRSKGKNMDR